MQVKLFIHDKSAFQRWSRFAANLEDEINSWLAVNPGIRIVHVTQSSNGGSFDTTKIIVSIWYEERGSVPAGWYEERGPAPATG